ncbi:AraC family transcriptional regulator [Paenibacillus hemerocallicola]|uniref:AraC family transcriptional regulator n=1 Tax=Paenibacillus hemerocallicola TaxID=1172614 RepID=A0A5C4T097_9BACL|nr:AraC family transcriptional regulator [Paenibacillus hemerocallicola]TNJ62492.1 AraC family transcriptional regulator [Paenibacillus hemerocallicola]
MTNYLNGMTVHLLWLANKITFKGWQDIRQTKGNHTFYWVYGGEGIFRTDQTHLVGKGMLVYMPPGQELHMQSSNDDPLVMMIARFECIVSRYSEPERTWITEPLERLGLPYLRLYEGERAMKFNRLFEELVRNWVPTREGGALLSKSRLLEILELAHREDPVEQSDDPALRAFQQIKTILEEQFHTPLQVYELAIKHSVSPSYLRKMFKIRLGLSPKAYLEKIRNDHAIRCLSYSDAPVRIVAMSCGYGDEFQFSKAFKKTNGCTPTAFRARQTARLQTT